MITNKITIQDPLIRDFMFDGESETKIIISCVGTGKSTGATIDRFMLDPILRDGKPAKNLVFDKICKKHGRHDLMGRHPIHRKGIIGRDSQKGFDQTLKDDILAVLTPYNAIVDINEQTHAGHVVVEVEGPKLPNGTKGPNQVLYTTFKVVHFSTPDGYQGVHGGNYDWFWLNEIGLSDMNKWDAISKIKGRIGRHNGRGVFVIDSNPPPPEHWIFTRLGVYLWDAKDQYEKPNGFTDIVEATEFLDKRTNQIVKTGKITLTVLKEHETIRQEPHKWSNPGLPGNYYQQRYIDTRNSPAQRAQLLLGIPSTNMDVNLVWSKFSHTENVQKEPPEKSLFIKGRPYIIGMDQDVKGGLVLLQRNLHNQIVVIDEIDFQEKKVKDWMDQVYWLSQLAHTYSNSGPEAVILDHAGFYGTVGTKVSNQAKVLSKETGFNIKAPVFNHKLNRADRAEIVSKLFTEHPFFRNDKHHRRLLISSRCKRLLTAISRWKFVTKTNQEGYTQLGEPEKGYYSGMCDALIFGAASMKEPMPQDVDLTKESRVRFDPYDGHEMLEHFTQADFDRIVANAQSGPPPRSPHMQ